MRQPIRIVISLLLSAILLFAVKANGASLSLDSEVIVELHHKSDSTQPSEFLLYELKASDYHRALALNLDVSVEKTKEWVRKNELPLTKSLLVDSSQQSTVSLPRHDFSGEKLYYLLLQKGPEAIEGSKFNKYQVFPSFISFDDVETDYLTIETKRVFFSQVPYFFKYSSDENSEPLENAEFALYELTPEAQKKYLTSIEPIEWQVLEDGNQAWTFKSDKQGLVLLPDLGLDLGTYYFEEIKAPVGYDITSESKKVPLIITEDSDGLTISVNGENLTPMQAGELPKEIVSKGQPRVLNKKKVTVPKEPPNLSDKTNKIVPKGESHQGILPKTGESKWMVSSVGLVIIAMTFLYKKRGRQNE